MENNNNNAPPPTNPAIKALAFNSRQQRQKRDAVIAAQAAFNKAIVAASSGWNADTRAELFATLARFNGAVSAMLMAGVSEIPPHDES